MKEHGRRTIYQKNEEPLAEMNKIMRGSLFVLVILVLSASSLPFITEGTSAHSPTFPGNNTSLTNSTLVQDPSKSWAIYTHLEESTVQYYALDLKAGDRLYLNLIVPTHEEGSGFLPTMAILGPFPDRNGSLPSSVQIPPGYGWKEINSTFPDQATYEAFSPSAFLNLAVFDENVASDGRYYVAVFQEPGLQPLHGDYGLAVGYVESFTISEFILIPISLLNVYQWEGQSLFQVFAPVAAVFLIGVIGLYLWRKEELAQMEWAHRLTLFSGLLFLGTATNTMIQMLIAISQTGLVLEVSVTLLFIVAPLLLGWLCLRNALGGRSSLTRRRRIEMFFIGLIGLFVWGGFIIGPIVGMLSSCIPAKERPN
jgi:hypothetical protein